MARRFRAPSNAYKILPTNDYRGTTKVLLAGAGRNHIALLAHERAGFAARSEQRRRDLVSSRRQAAELNGVGPRRALPVQRDLAAAVEVDRLRNDFDCTVLRIALDLRAYDEVRWSKRHRR